MKERKRGKCVHDRKKLEEYELRCGKKNKEKRKTKIEKEENKYE